MQYVELTRTEGKRIEFKLADYSAKLEDVYKEFEGFLTNLEDLLISHLNAEKIVKIPVENLEEVYSNLRLVYKLITIQIYRWDILKSSEEKFLQDFKRYHIDMFKVFEFPAHMKHSQFLCRVVSSQKEFIQSMDSFTSRLSDHCSTIIDVFKLLERKLLKSSSTGPNATVIVKKLKNLREIFPKSAAKEIEARKASESLSTELKRVLDLIDEKRKGSPSLQKKLISQPEKNQIGGTMNSNVDNVGSASYF